MEKVTLECHEGGDKEATSIFLLDPAEKTLRSMLHDHSPQIKGTLGRGVVCVCVWLFQASAVPQMWTLTVWTVKLHSVAWLQNNQG